MEEQDRTYALDAELENVHEAYARQIQKLQGKIAQYKRLPKEEELDEDAVLMFVKSFRRGFNPHTFNGEPATYTYCAMRVPRIGWYITGKNAAHPMSYAELCAFVVEKGQLHEVWIVSEWQQLT